MVQRLCLHKKLPIHYGCVNCICWSDSGQYLLSGSDDHSIILTNAFKNYKTEVRYKTKHTSNIFNAKFLPCRDNTNVVTCSGDGLISHSDLRGPALSARELQSTENCFSCHMGTVYELATIPQDPNTFLSAGEDYTVRCFDLRVKSKCNNPACDDDVLIQCRSAVTAIDINQKIPYQMAIGTSDSSVRIFDRRMLGTVAAGFKTKNTTPLAVFTADGLDERPYRITSVNYSPDGKDVLASYSSEYLYLFNVEKESVKSWSCSSRDLDQSEEDVGGGAIGGDDDDVDEGANSLTNRGGIKECPVRRLRLRGDWSDTGPDARPERETGSLGGNSSPESPRSTLHSTVMQRMTDLLTRIINDPATRAAIVNSNEPDTTIISDHESPVTRTRDGHANAMLLYETIENEVTNDSQLSQPNESSTTSTQTPPTVPVPSHEGETDGTTTTTQTATTTTTDDEIKNTIEEATTSKTANDHENNINNLNQMNLGEERDERTNNIDSKTTKTKRREHNIKEKIDEEENNDDNTKTNCDTQSALSINTNINLKQNNTKLINNNDVAMASIKKQNNTERWKRAAMETINKQNNNPKLASDNNSNSFINQSIDGNYNYQSIPSKDTILFDEQIASTSESSHEQIASTSQSSSELIPSTSQSSSELIPSTSQSSSELIPSTSQSSSSSSSSSTSTHFNHNLKDSSIKKQMKILRKDFFNKCGPNSNNTNSNYIKTNKNVSNSNNERSKESNEELETKTNDKQLETKSNDGHLETKTNDLQLETKINDLQLETKTNDKKLETKTNVSTECIVASSSNQQSLDVEEEQNEQTQNDNDNVNNIEEQDEVEEDEHTQNESDTNNNNNNDDDDDNNEEQQDLHDDQDEYPGGNNSVRWEGTANDDADNEEDDDDDDNEKHKKKYKRFNSGFNDLNARKIKFNKKFTGHRNARTMIKEANFWGDNYILSGSDCGHVFIWDRHTTELVMLLQADKHVVNCVQPHPSLPILATSGIDHDVKIWEPFLEESGFDEIMAQELIKRNEVMLEETRDTITVPASFMIRMLAFVNQLRRGDNRIRRGGGGGSSSSSNGGGTASTGGGGGSRPNVSENNE